MKLSRFTTCFAVLAALAMASFAQADEFAGNPGFEDALGATNGTPVEGNWFGFTGPGAVGVGRNTIDPRTDAQHAELVIAGAGNSFVGLQQIVDSVVVGETYTFSFHAKTDGGTYDVGNEYRIEWIDGTGAEISRDQLTDSFESNTYSQFTVSGAAPTGAVQLRAVIALQSFQGGTLGTARIDDTSIMGPAAVPEPTSVALLGMGALALVTRRRRS